ncbi:hypothetical protein OA07_04825 [Aphanizomenon flos-aquae 2012/KM1/D3]|uniref:hypothetical protein n=1 Tax=Aphanizomenon flos-aquae TaxID=1176 RepID=UPI00054262A8|nr:hypothetical protein [Aphanizomenon flos-aquae]KHG42480.1 hypothetical protein OA07_04825 [Aphanizomenon flos-aquae 2012/KM1/D3]
MSESGLPGFKDIQDLIDFLPDEDKYNIPSFPIVGLTTLAFRQGIYSLASYLKIVCGGCQNQDYQDLRMYRI